MFLCVNASSKEEGRRNAGNLHPKMKLLRLPECKRLTSSIKGGTNGFGGSGSTLIACENTGRSCCTMEYEPDYCDAITHDGNS